jgi:crossover junction endodeoxyribonuclease RuvC
VNSFNPGGENTVQSKALGPACFRVLGVDPAAAGPTGYGVVESDGRNCRLLHYGALRVAAKRQNESLGAVLQDVHELLCKLIEEYSPQALAVEGIFSALNVRTALRLAEVRGVVLLAAAQHEVQVHSYSPREVKASVAGYGNADKRQMQMMVRALLQMTETPEPADAADALAVALCHLQAQQTRTRYVLPETKNLDKPVSRRRNSSAAIAATNATSLTAPLSTPIATLAAGPRIVIPQ